MEEVYIEKDFLTLGQFLKFVGIIDTGGQAKFFLMENKVFINDQLEERRGKKLYPNDIIKVENFGKYILIK